MAGTADTLGVIFAVFLVLGGIALAVWYFAFRKPSNEGGPMKCTKDSDCSDNSAGVTFQEQFQGQICVSGVCQNVACKRSNSTCAVKLPGSTCFGVGPKAASTDQSCLPMACRTTDDCANSGGGGDAMTENVVCVPGTQAGKGICVPQTPPDKKGGCYKITGLSLDSSTGKCVVCGDSVGNCSAGSHCVDGRCFRCGDTESKDDLCENKKNTDGPGAWNFCDTGKSMCPTDFECTRQLPDSQGTLETIQLPSGKALDSGVGICLPANAECVYSWFNPAASPTGSGPKPFPGQCPSSAPYCSVAGTCEITPTAGKGAVCGYLPGVGGNGMTTASNGTYDVTGICSGRLVPKNSYANIANFTTEGTPISGGGSTTCNVGSDNKAPKCVCDTTKNECPEGTYCQILAVTSSSNADPTTQGFCTISAGTGASKTAPAAPLSGHLGHYYANSFCSLPPDGGVLPVCIELPTPAQGAAVSSFNGPGDFCYNTSQCLYNGKSQGPGNTLRALVCETSKSRCIGGTTP